jgi:hypothetical protein
MCMHRKFGGGRCAMHACSAYGCVCMFASIQVYVYVCMYHHCTIVGIGTDVGLIQNLAYLLIGGWRLNSGL